MSFLTKALLKINQHNKSITWKGQRATIIHRTYEHVSKVNLERSGPFLYTQITNFFADVSFFYFGLKMQKARNSLQYLHTPTLHSLLFKKKKTTIVK